MLKFISKIIFNSAKGNDFNGKLELQCNFLIKQFKTADSNKKKTFINVQAKELEQEAENEASS